MNLEIICRNRGKKELLEVCTHWLAQELKIRKNKFNLTVALESGLKSEVGARGLASILSDKNYVVALDSRLDFDTMMRTLCHEMVHIKQFVRGQYRTELRRGRVIFYWKEVQYRNPKYHESPWEIEAAGKEGLLALKMNGLMNELSGKV